MTHKANGVNLGIYKLTQEYPSNTLRFYVYNGLEKEMESDHKMTNDELYNIMMDCGREWQEHRREENE